MSSILLLTILAELSAIWQLKSDTECSKICFKFRYPVHPWSASDFRAVRTRYWCEMSPYFLIMPSWHLYVSGWSTNRVILWNFRRLNTFSPISVIKFFSWTQWPLVRKRTVPTERPPLVGEIYCQLLRKEGCRVVSAVDPPTVVKFNFIDYSRYFSFK
jgi:hypothetical protein